MPTFGELVRRNGRVWAGKDAFIELDRRMTWGAFHARTDALGHALRAAGVRPGDRVAMLSTDSVEVVELFIACAKIGAVRVGLNARLAPPEIVALIADCEPTLLFVQAACAPLISASATPTVGFGTSHSFAIDYEELIARHKRDGALEETPSDTVMIAYTTGSTGLPKGAIYPHRNFLHSILYNLLYEAAGHDAVWLHGMPAAGIPIMHMLRGVFSGASTVIVGAWDAARAMHLLGRERCTNTTLVPTMLNSLLALPDFGKHDVSSMRLMGYGASPLPAATIREAMRAFGCPFLQMYGSTELVGMVTMLLPSDHQRGLDVRPEILASAGKPLSFAELRVVDDDGRDVAPGEIGEVIARSEIMFPGYWRAPEKFAETMIDGWVHTGDMGRIDHEGYVYLGDRTKFRIKTGGYNVFPTEVENVLAEHPAVDEVAVIGLPDDTWGERIHAVVTLKPGARAETDVLRDFCRGKIANFKLPKTLEIWPELPKGPTGKIQKRAIIARCSEGGV